MNFLAIFMLGVVAAAVIAIAVAFTRRSPNAALYVVLFFPILTLVGLASIFSIPAIQAALNPNPTLVSQLLSVSVGAVIGIVGAGTLALVQERWTQERSQRDRDFELQRNQSDRDWELRSALASRLNLYPYNPNALNYPQRLEIVEILSHAENDVKHARNLAVIPNDSVFAAYVEEMKARYPKPE